MGYALQSIHASRTQTIQASSSQPPSPQGYWNGDGYFKTCSVTSASFFFGLIFCQETYIAITLLFNVYSLICAVTAVRVPFLIWQRKLSVQIQSGFQSEKKRPRVNLIFIILIPDGRRSMFVFHIPKSIFPITSKPRRIMSPIRMIFF